MIRNARGVVEREQVPRPRGLKLPTRRPRGSPLPKCSQLPARSTATSKVGAVSKASQLAIRTSQHVACHSRSALEFSSESRGRAARLLQLQRARCTKYDLFLSYPRRDPVGPWVQDHFFPLLSRWLGAAMAQPPVLFLDREMETGTDWPASQSELHARTRTEPGVRATRRWRKRAAVGMSCSRRYKRHSPEHLNCLHTARRRAS